MEHNCSTNPVIYSFICNLCFEKRLGSATNFKNRFRIHKSDIRTTKDLCGTEWHSNKCFDSHDPHKYLAVYIIEATTASDNKNVKSCYDIEENTE